MTGGRGRRLRAAWWPASVAAALVLVPLWVTPVLVTTDGPNHVYNAVVANAVAAGRPPLAAAFAFEHDPTRPNQLAEQLLAAAGAALGFEAAERLVATVAVSATFALVLALAGPATVAAPVPWAAALTGAAAGWLAHNWFLWMGFYDFALSIPLFGALLLVLRDPLTRGRHVAAQVLLLALYFTHFFTLVVAVALVVVTTAWRARRGEAPWSHVAAAVPAAVLAVLATSGGLGGGVAPTWRPLDSLVGVAAGDFVIAFHPADAVAGVAIMGAVAWAAVRCLRGDLPLAGPEVFGLLLVGASLVLPHNVGEGGYVPARARILGVLACLPAAAAVLERLSPPVLRFAAVVGLLALTVHAGVVLRAGRTVARDLATLEGLLTTAGAGPDAWTRSGFVDVRRDLYRIPAYRHLSERIAARRELVVLDNYQTLHPVFPVYWRSVPDWLALRPETGGMTLRLAPAARRWPEAVYLLHDSAYAIVTADTALALGPTAHAGSFAVTPVRRR